MATKPKRHSMAEALKEREEVRAFLDAGKSSSQSNEVKPQERTNRKNPERRIAVTLRLPEKIAHALIDASAERRKNREMAWSQQDIVAEALGDWLEKIRS